jgi:hypothetical protein
MVDRAIKNDDGALHWYSFEACDPHNFYRYEDPSAEEVTMIPWDLDNSFENLLDDSFAGGLTRIADAWGDISDNCEPFPSATVTLDSAFTDERVLTAHLEHLFAGEVLRLKVKKVDLVSDTAVVDVRFRLNDDRAAEDAEIPP